MGKYKRRADKRLARRIKGYEETVKRDTKHQHHRPGSQKKH